jgi:hypothetical protein
MRPHRAAADGELTGDLVIVQTLGGPQGDFTLGRRQAGEHGQRVAAGSDGRDDAELDQELGAGELRVPRVQQPHGRLGPIPLRMPQGAFARKRRAGPIEERPCASRGEFPADEADFTRQFEDGLERSRSNPCWPRKN